MSEGKEKEINSLFSKITKVLAFIGVTMLCLLVILLGVVWVFEKGPAPSVTAAFCKSMRETSALKFIPGIFLKDEEIDAFKSVSTEEADTAEVNTSLIRISDSGNTGSGEPAFKVIDIASGTCKGKLMIVRDPKRVTLGVSDQFAFMPGLELTEMVKKYDAVAGINAGGFKDEGGQGNGGTPEGLVIHDGEIIWGDGILSYNVVGLDGAGVLIVGTMTGYEAVEAGVVNGVSFKTYDGLASSLIINGEVQEQNLGSGVNPRTAIGQRSDGAILLLVLDGRSINTLGATMNDVVDIMLEYGAVNAGNLDGGSSSVMVYNGEIINNCASVTGPRKIPTGFLVLKEDHADA